VYIVCEEILNARISLWLPTMASTKASELNPRTTKYEFMGPPGALAVSLGVPFMAYALYFICNERVGACPPSFDYMLTSFQSSITDSAFWKSLYDPTAFAIYLSWYFFCVLAWAILPGDWVQGTQLRNGKYQSYKINGACVLSPLKIYSYVSLAFSTLLLALGLTAGYIIRFGPQSFTFLYEHWVGLTTAALWMSAFQGFLWYGFSFYGDKLLALGGNSGNAIYDVRLNQAHCRQSS
jgi:Delta14-sterol reductase